MSAETLSINMALRRGDFRLSLDETLPLGGVTAVLGRSGCGKTSLLRAIAGLEPIEKGQISLGGRMLCDTSAGTHVPAHRRGVGYVFQDARLFSHLDVAGNLGFAARRARKAGAEPDVERAIRATGIGALLERRPDTLSGGESRRVALARSLVSVPYLLLLDEPLSGLDRAARRAILPFLRALPEEAGCPILYVSHDIEEVAVLADHVLVLDAGQAVANGPILEVARRLDLGPLREADAPAALIEAAIAEHDPRTGLARLDFNGQHMFAAQPGTVAAGSRVRLLIDARDVSLARERPASISIRNILKARIEAISAAGPDEDVDVELALGASRFWSRITQAARDDLGLETGEDIYALIKTVRLAGQG